MTTTTTTTSLPTSPLLLPILTTLVGTGGFTVGIYSFLNPSAAARIYGVPFPAASQSTLNTIPDLTLFLVPSDSKAETTRPKPSTSTLTSTLSQQHTNQTEQQAQHTQTLIHSLGIRNLTTGLTILLLTGYYYRFLPLLSNVDTGITVNNLAATNTINSTTATATATALAVKDSLRTTLGLVISIGSLVPFVDAWVCWGWARTRNEEQRQEQKGDADVDVDSAVARRAGWLHFGRGWVWVGVGVWCLLGW